MKALTIPASRTSMRERMRSISARVSNLKDRVNPRVSLAVAAAATFALFIALGLMHTAAITVCSITAAAALAITPTTQEGGEA